MQKGKLVRRLLVGLVFVSACAQGEADDSARVAATAPGHLVHRMPTGSTSTASLHTLPNATCLVHDKDKSGDPTQQLRVYSDDDGVARIQLDHLDMATKHGQLAIDCTDDTGKTQKHVLEVVIDDSASPQKPEKYKTDGKPTLAKLDVPADSLSDADIDARHYPPKPDKIAHPEQYQAWLDAVSSGATVVNPHIVVDKDRNHGSVSSTSNNWSGYVIASPATAPIYAYVYGEWNVPRAYAESGFYSSDHSSFWVGIDGWGSNDVVQDGTDSDTFTLFWVQTSSYGAWVEWYPLSSQSVSNFPVNPGDRLHVWTWVRDSANNWSSKPTVGWFYMWNSTQNVYVYTSINIPAGANFSGHAAEWVMERPTVNGSLASLADYSSNVQLTAASAYDIWGGQHWYGGDSSNTSINVTMTGNGNAALSTVTPVNSSTMAFSYHGHN